MPVFHTKTIESILEPVAQQVKYMHTYILHTFFIATFIFSRKIYTDFYTHTNINRLHADRRMYMCISYFILVPIFIERRKGRCTE